MLALAAACSGDPRRIGPSFDAGPAFDSGPGFDGGPGFDAAFDAVGDGGAFDARGVDGGRAIDGGPGFDGGPGVDGGLCVPMDLCDGEGGDEDCDGRVDEGCAECPVAHVTCVSGCCEVPETEISEKGAYPDLEVDGRGNVYVLYTVVSGGYWATRFARFDADTSTWSDQSLGDEGSDRAVLKLDRARGILHALYARRSGALVYKTSTDGGMTWTEGPILPGTLGIGGTLDLTLAEDGTAHVVYIREDGSVWDELHYAVLGASWSTEVLDSATTGIDHPRVVLGFADRPFIVYEAYEPEGVSSGRAVRMAHYDGAAWRYQNIIDDPALAYGRDRQYFNRFDVDITADDELRLSYSRAGGTGPTQNVYATRSASGIWAEEVLPLDDVAGAALEYQADGRLLFVGDGLELRQDTSGGWRTQALSERAGEGAAIQRVGDFLYVVYTSDITRDALMFARVPLL